jgi:hypothetical protein
VEVLWQGCETNAKIYGVRIETDRAQGKNIPFNMVPRRTREALDRASILKILSLDAP